MALLQTWNVVTGNALGSSLCQKLNSQWAMMQDDKKTPRWDHSPAMDQQYRLVRTVLRDGWGKPR